VRPGSSGLTHNLLMPISALLFDFDGTLHDRTRSLRSFLPWHATLLSTRNPNDFTQRFLELDNFGYRPKEEVYEILIEEFQLKKMSVSELMVHYRNLSLPYTVEMKGATSMLETLKSKGLKIAIVTNGATSFQKERISFLRHDEYADAVLVSEEEGVKKPNREIFCRAAARVGVPISECLFVGDHPLNDVVGPQKIGMQAVWFENGEFAWPDIPQPQLKISSLSDLHSLLSEEFR